MPLILFTLLLALAIARSPAPTRETLTTFFRAFARRHAEARALGHPGRADRRLRAGAAAGGRTPARRSPARSASTSSATRSPASSRRCCSIRWWRSSDGFRCARFARAALPPQLIAFSSSSSIASLPALVESAETHARTAGAESPDSSCRSPSRRSRSPRRCRGRVGALFVGWFYGVPLHASADWRRSPSPPSSSRSRVPGIPRGAFIMLTPLFLAIGLPAEGIGILIAVDAIPDTFRDGAEHDRLSRGDGDRREGRRG